MKCASTFGNMKTTHWACMGHLRLPSNVRSGREACRIENCVRRRFHGFLAFYKAFSRFASPFVLHAEALPRF